MDDAPLTLLPLGDLVKIAPMLAAGLSAIVVLLLDLALPPAKRGALAFVALAGLVVALVVLHAFGRVSSEPIAAFYDCLRFDRLTFLAHNLILASAVFFVLVSPRYLQDRLLPWGEYYALILFAAMAMMALAASRELVTMFVNLELLSFTLYVLAGLERENLRSTEAAFKYFTIGSYAAAFMLFGLALIYGATGATQFDVIAESLAAGELRGPLPSSIALSAGLALAMVGFGFKLTLAPFQMYAPDVYAGAPTPVAGLIATGSKVATMAILFQLLSVIAGWADRPDALYWGLYAMTVASIVVGGVGAIVQANFKRLMAYSGVSHGGYMMLALVPALRDPSLLDDSRRAIAYYLIAYVLMTATAFGVAASLGSEGDGKLDRFSGLGRRSPLLAGALAISLLSLTGVPPTVGFFGKVYLFSIPIAAGDYLLAVLGVLASVASAYYYLRAIVRMYMEEPHRDRREPPRVEIFNAFAVAVGSAGVLLVALWPVMDSWVD